MGRWYEIVRTPNTQQRNCHGAYQTWSARPDGDGDGDGDLDIGLVCHAGGRAGRARHVATKAWVTDVTTNAKLEASFSVDCCVVPVSALANRPA